MISQNVAALPLDSLTKHQVGNFGLYWAKMYFTGLGLDVIDKEEKGNSFFIKKKNSSQCDVYVRTARPKNKISYSFITKETWQYKLPDNYLVALVFIEGNLPIIYLIPAVSWRSPNTLLVNRDYKKEGQISKPEWGISTNQKNMDLLNEFELLKQLRNLHLDI